MTFKWKKTPRNYNENWQTQSINLRWRLQNCLVKSFSLMLALRAVCFCCFATQTWIFSEMLSRNAMQTISPNKWIIFCANVYAVFVLTMSSQRMKEAKKKLEEEIMESALLRISASIQFHSLSFFHRHLLIHAVAFELILHDDVVDAECMLLRWWLFFLSRSLFILCTANARRQLASLLFQFYLMLVFSLVLFTLFEWHADWLEFSAHCYRRRVYAEILVFILLPIYLFNIHQMLVVLPHTRYEMLYIYRKERSKPRERESNAKRSRELTKLRKKVP